MATKKKATNKKAPVKATKAPSAPVKKVATKSAAKGPSDLQRASQALLDTIDAGRPGQKECRLVREALSGSKFAAGDAVYLSAALGESKE